MQNGAYGTVEVPAAPKKKSIKRLVVTSAAISLALGFATVTAVDHGLIRIHSHTKGRRERDDYKGAVNGRGE